MFHTDVRNDRDRRYVAINPELGLEKQTRNIPSPPKPPTSIMGAQEEIVTA